MKTQRLLELTGLTEAKYQQKDTLSNLSANEVIKRFFNHEEEYDEGYHAFVPKPSLRITDHDGHEVFYLTYSPEYGWENRGEGSDTWKVDPAKFNVCETRQIYKR